MSRAGSPRPRDTRPGTWRPSVSSAPDVRRILVVVKTYPNPSVSYVETVCCAGVDLDTGRWVRMYPITFRRLADKRFKKYQIITCEVGPPRQDNRPESLRVDQDTIKLVGDPMPPGTAGWQKRMATLPPIARSLEEIQEAQRLEGTSIGMFRPKLIKGLVKRKAKAWTERKRAALRQQRLGLGEAELAELADLEQIPWSFATGSRATTSGAPDMSSASSTGRSGSRTARGRGCTGTTGRRSSGSGTSWSCRPPTCTSWSAT